MGFSFQNSTKSHCLFKIRYYNVKSYRKKKKMNLSHKKDAGMYDRRKIQEEKYNCLSLDQLKLYNNQNDILQHSN
jgi:hypothetical protein